MKNKGFTLVELLVVMAVISLLSSITGASLRSAQEKAKETIRTDTKNTVIEALNAYYLDHGVYPSSGGSYVCLGPQTTTCWNNHHGNDALWAQLSPYLTRIPVTNAPPGTYAHNAFKYLSPTGWPDLGAVLIWPSSEPITTAECPNPGVIDHADLYYYCWQWIWDN